MVIDDNVIQNVNFCLDRAMQNLLNKMLAEVHLLTYGTGKTVFVVHQSKRY